MHQDCLHVTVQFIEFLKRFAQGSNFFLFDVKEKGAWSSPLIRTIKPLKESCRWLFICSEINSKIVSFKAFIAC